MGNTVISGILFQPPSPPIALDYQGPADSNNNGNGDKPSDNNEAIKKTLAKNKRHNISLSYLWLYSQGDYSNEWNLIPAVHITHNDAVDNNSSQESSQSSAAANTQKYTLLYSHGNAEDIGLISSFLCDLARLLQINVLCYDYSGYGVSTDEATVAEFFRGFGEEVEAWKVWRLNNQGNYVDREGAAAANDNNGMTAAWGEVAARKNGHMCRFSTEVFAAPMIHPKANSDYDDWGQDDIMFNGNGTGASAHKDDEDDNAYDFSNACGAFGDVEFDHNINHASNGVSQQAGITTEGGGANSTNEATMSPNKRRQSFLRRNQWNTPSPSEMSCYANIQAVYNYLTSVQRILPKHVILYGKSVGSGPTCWLTQQLCRNEFGSTSSVDDDTVSCATDEMCNIESREPAQAKERETLSGGKNKKKNDLAPGGVVLHSPFLSVIRVVLDVGFTTIGDLFPNVDRVADFTCPVYVIHGSNDTIVPFYHGETLFQNLPNKSKTVPFWARGAGHNNIEMDMPTAYIKRLQQFIRQCDRLNYPSQMSARKVQLQKRQEQQRQQIQAIEQMQAHHQQQMMLQANLQASLRQSMGQQQQQGGSATTSTSTRPGITRYASQDSYHQLMMMQSQAGAMGSKPSKQRKQKGTLVMKSSHNHLQLQPLPPQVSPTFNQQQQRRPAQRSNSNSGVGGRTWIAAPSLTSQQQQQPGQLHKHMNVPNNNYARYNQPNPTMNANADDNNLSSSHRSLPSLGNRAQRPIMHQQQYPGQVHQSYQ